MESRIMNLAEIATKAGLSPTFINWFESNPEDALRELWKWWSLKDDIAYYFKFVLLQQKFHSCDKCNPLEIARHNRFCEECTKYLNLPYPKSQVILAKEIESLNLMKENLF